MKNKEIDSSPFGCIASRSYLTELFLIKVKERKYTIAEVIEKAGICRTTYYNIRTNELPTLATLRCLFAASFDPPLLTPGEAAVAVELIIADNLPGGTPLPRFRVVAISPKPACSHKPSIRPPSLPVYMEHLRTYHLDISMREVCRRFEHCDTLQLGRIETDCCRVGIGPICYLFNNYLHAIPALPRQEWGTFATLLLHHQFPAITGYEMVLEA